MQSTATILGQGELLKSGNVRRCLSDLSDNWRLGSV
jgi:hypothetical protein